MLWNRVLAIAFLFSPTIGTTVNAQITNIDELLETARKKASSQERAMGENLCDRKGFQFQTQAHAQIELPLGTSAKEVSRSLIDAGFKEIRSVASGSRPMVRSFDPFICGQSSFKVVEHCRLDEHGLKTVIVRVGEVEVGGECIYGLAKPLIVKEFELLKPDQAIHNNTMRYLGLTSGISWEDSNRHLLSQGWKEDLDDFLKDHSTKYCKEISPLTSVSFFEKVSEDEKPRILKIRLKHELFCDDNSKPVIGKLLHAESLF